MMFVYWKSEDDKKSGLVHLKDDKVVVAFMDANPTHNVVVVAGDPVKLDQVLTAQGWGFVKPIEVKVEADGYNLYGYKK